MTKPKPNRNTAPANRGQAKPLPRVTLYDFFEAQPRGTQTKMAAALNVSKSTLSNIAAADRPEEPGPRVFVSYRLARALQSFVKARGFDLDIEPLLRTEEASP